MKTDFIARMLAPGEPPLLIAEAGVNHNGDADLAEQLVQVAADAGADAVKFQTFRAEALASEGAELADYQRAAGETCRDQLELLRRLELSQAQHERLARRAASLELAFLSTPFDFESAKMLVALGVPLLKVPSGELNNLLYLERLAGLGLPLLLSTGMGTMGEVEAAVHTIQRRWASDGHSPVLALLHCTSCYPALPAEANLRAMETLARAFGLPVGLSDHTLGTEVSLAAVALGARVIEKHFTTDRKLPGPDHRASLEPGELAALATGMSHVFEALGSAAKAPVPREEEIRRIARRSLVASRNLPAGTHLTEDMLDARRPAIGLSPSHFRLLLGRALARPVAEGELLSLADLAPEAGPAGTRDVEDDAVAVGCPAGPQRRQPSVKP